MLANRVDERAEELWAGGLQKGHQEGRQEGEIVDGP
jgi:hypothetical protein